MLFEDRSAQMDALGLIGSTATHRPMPRLVIDSKNKEVAKSEKELQDASELVRRHLTAAPRLPSYTVSPPLSGEQ
jgi:hypothetical protein